MGKIITVTSLKGGVGKTTVSAALAHALAKSEKKTLAVDMNVGVKGLDIALGHENSALPDFIDVINGNASLEESVEADSRSDKLFFLTAPLNAETGAEVFDKVADFLRKVKQEYDYVILDTATGSGELLTAVCDSGETDTFLIVCTQNAASVRAAEKLGSDLYKTGNEDIKLIIDLFNCEGNSKLMGITEIVGLASITLIGVIPFDGQTEELVSSGKTVLEGEKCLAGKAVENVAKRIAGENVPLLDGIVPKWRKAKLY